MKTHSVLLVDDDVTSNFISQKVLHSTGLFNHITIAQNGREALEFLSGNCATEDRTECPDIIFLDLKMPVLDGFNFLKQLRSFEMKESNFRIFILSSSVNPKDLAMVKGYNIEGYISKPLSEEKVMEIIH